MREWRVRISEEDFNFIQDIAEQKKIPRNSMHKGLEFILDDYRQLDMQRFDLRFVADELKNELLAELRNAIKEEVAEEMKRIRLGTNNTDRNTQILIELLQGYIVQDGKKAIPTTEAQKPFFLQVIEEYVQNRINDQMMKKRSSQQKNSDN